MLITSVKSSKNYGKQIKGIVVIDVVVVVLFLSLLFSQSSFKSLSSLGNSKGLD